ncbi:MAG TPA: hypothetical protein VNU95_02370 [Candidatus Acidoferrales bacterium]|jgi:hypothetical protein|nr:hypothetical protein [Candidatus Acidoferrales bacterium]
MVQLFEKFAEMVEKLPTRAIVKAVQLERQMLETDLAQKRSVPMADARSIMAFCDFLQHGPSITRVSRVSIPIQHLGFYRSTVKRLVENGELPYQAGEVFEHSFSSAMLTA